MGKLIQIVEITYMHLHSTAPEQFIQWKYQSFSDTELSISAMFIHHAR